MSAQFTRTPRFAVVTALVLVMAPFAAATAAFAQGTTRSQPESGLFGPRNSTSSQRDRLNLTFTFTEAVDTELPPELASRLPRGDLLATGGLSTNLTGAGDYTVNGRRFRLAANGRSTFRYFERVNRFDAVSHTGGVGVNFDLPKRASLQIDQRAAYSPSYLHQLFPATAPPALGAPIDAAPDYEIVQSDSYMYQSELKLSKRIANATSANGSVSYDRTDFRGLLAAQNRRPKLDSYRLEANVSQGLNRNFGLLFGYQYRTGDFGFGVSKEHRAAIGAEYSRALSRSRRFVVSGQIAPSTIAIPEFTLSQVPPGRAFRLQGGISVEYPFKYNWVAAGTLQRGIDYLAVLSEPVLSNGGQLSIRGLITRRVDVSATVGFVNSASPLSQSTQLDSTNGNVRLRYAFSRHLAFFSEYVYYAYDLSGQESLQEILPPIVDQHGFRAGVMLWASPF